MELNQKLISKIAETFGMNAEDLTAKITSEAEADIELPGQLFTEEELKARDSSKYNEGKIAASERQVKDAKQKYGYELDGVKDIDGFLAHHEEQLKTKYSKNSNDRIKELESDIDKMKKSHLEEIGNYESKVSDLSGKYKEQDNKNYLLSIMPKDTILKPEALITLFKSEFELDSDEGQRLLKKGGQVLKNEKTASPLDPKEVFNDWLVKEKYVSATAGRGGDNEFGKGGNSNIKSIKEFQAKWQKNNPDQSLGSPKYSTEYAQWRSENKEVTA